MSKLRDELPNQCSCGQIFLKLSRRAGCLQGGCRANHVLDMDELARIYIENRRLPILSNMSL